MTYVILRKELEEQKAPTNTTNEELTTNTTNEVFIVDITNEELITTEKLDYTKDIHEERKKYFGKLKRFNI